MAVLEILVAPHPKLKIKATEVTDVSKVQQLIDDLLDTMYDTEDGIGLAATQVGSKHAVVVIDISEERNDPLILINPKVESGDSLETGQEGCLSIPGYYADVERYTHVIVTALDREGNEIRIENDDFLAIAMQHEIDHLKGKLFIDYLSPLKKKMALKKVKKYISQ